jgi:peptidoglycan/LPS O-acetylase OafA/YrhL
MRRIETVEAARGLAAAAVVVFHANAAVTRQTGQGWPWLNPLEHGVDFFFVLSGFIIFHVHRADMGNPAAAATYVWKRITRLFPILWLVVLSYAFANWLQGEVIPWSSLGTSLLLYPSAAEPAPMILWTLRHELLFYAAFLVLIVSRRAGTILLSIWTLAVLIQLLIGIPSSGILAFLLSSYQLDFMLGIGVAYFLKDKPPTVVPLLMGAALVILALWLTKAMGLVRTGFDDYTSPGATTGVVMLGLAFAVLLYGLLRAEASIAVPRSLLALGAASYAIYLIHTPANSVAQHLARFLPMPLALACIVAIGIAAGMLLHLKVEVPISRRLRRRVHGKSSRS